MRTPDEPGHGSGNRIEQLSTRIAFFIAGFAVSAWAPLVPFAKARAGLGDGELGLLLLCLGLGSILAMPLAGYLASRYGCRRLFIVAAILIGASLPMLAATSSAFVLGVALLVFGAGIGTADCVVNIQAVIVERASGRIMMSGFHGLFSVGGMAGAGSVSALLASGASPLTAAICVVVGIVIALACALPGLLTYGGRGDGPSFAMPHGAVLFIGVLCFIVFLTEGAMLDWSAVFLNAVRGAEPSLAGLGYTAFALTMTVGRLTGDAVVRRIGHNNIILGGGLCAAAGLGLAILVPSFEAALVGYALVGAGCSNIVPVLYTAAGRQTAMPEHIAIPAITTLGYFGILGGPAFIGMLAHLIGLPLAFAAVAILLLGLAGAGRLLRI
jgi:MFS family permease